MTDWPPSLRMRTIDIWPGERTPSHARRDSPFEAGLSETLQLLARELRMLSATDIWLEVAISADQFRNDGRPRASARASHPGVVVSFRSLNLRAIALGLEALRKVERYGIANRGEQYAGWSQLTAGGPNPARGHDLIRQHGGVRPALHATHPDHGGDPKDFADVQAAREEGAT